MAQARLLMRTVTNLFVARRLVEGGKVQNVCVQGGLPGVIKLPIVGGSNNTNLS